MRERAYTPNVAMIRDARLRIVHHLPREVRAELMAGVKAGHLGICAKKG